jgi:glycerol-3-phosphate acyltransferase PlsY
MIGDALSISPLLFLLIPLAFVMGSIPFGLVFTKSSGIDLRSTGSKNIGATNVLRSVGKVPALLTLLGDLLKGAVPVLICIYAVAQTDLSSHSKDLASMVRDLWPGIIGVTAVLGHMYSVFLSFKGGKGVATGLGVLLAYSPLVALIMFFVWITAAYLFRYSSLAAISAVTVMPIAFILLKASNVKVTVGIILTLLIVYKHKSNIKNLIAGTEGKIGNKS